MLTIDSRMCKNFKNNICNTPNPIFSLFIFNSKIVVQVFNYDLIYLSLPPFGLLMATKCSIGLNLKPRFTDLKKIQINDYKNLCTANFYFYFVTLLLITLKLNLIMFKMDFTSSKLHHEA